MSSINLRRLDLNLLTAFEAVYEEGSQLKASERLALSQPAVSSAITRLRQVAGDRLFVGTRNMRPTSKADELYLQIKPALDGIRKGFDQGTSLSDRLEREFTIAVAYGGGYLMGEPLYRRMKAEAPGSTLNIRSIDQETEIPSLLRQQVIDAAVTSRRFEDTMLRSDLCFEYDVGVIVRHDHPRIHKESTPQNLLAERFIWVSGSALERSPKTKELQGFVEAAERRVDIVVPNVLVVPTVVEKSDLVALMPWSFALRFSATYDVKALKLPIKQKTDLVSLVWHSAYESDPGINWFLKVCKDAACEIRARTDTSPLES